MFVLCDNCKNHYDDSFQSKKCRGIGAGVSGMTSNSHEVLRSKPVDEHVVLTQHTRAAATADALRGSARASKARERAGTGPTTDAPPSDG